MEKLAYLMGSSLPGSDLRAELIGAASAELERAGALDIEIFVDDLEAEQSETLSGNGSDGYLSAVVTVWLESLDDRGALEGPLRELSDRLAVYLVSESIPREYAERSWPEDERSPGVCIVSAFPKPERVDDETFYACWHGSHTPLSLRIHPLTRYVRNAVVRSLTPGAPDYRALVCESVGSFQELADPMIFYGSEEGRRETMEDLLKFADLETMQSVPMSEYLVNPGPWKAWRRNT
ncbi:EthD domain-containing protein [Myxococcota bacterium]|nr:EthD domain-containing protein [Myxococcota bacterium]